MSKRISAFGNEDNEEENRPKRPLISFSSNISGITTSTPTSVNNNSIGSSGISFKNNAFNINNSNNNKQPGNSSTSTLKNSKFIQDDDSDESFFKPPPKRVVQPFGIKDEEEERMKIKSTITTTTFNDENENVYNKEEEEDEEDEVDPLDAFMKDVNSSLEKSQKPKQLQQKSISKRDDIEDEDDEEAFYKLRQKQKSQQPNQQIQQQQQQQQEDDVDYSTLEDDDEYFDDEESLNNLNKRKKIIEPLPPIDHSKENYIEFNKYFYDEHEEISNLTEEKVFELRKELDIRIQGEDLINPVTSFGHFGFDSLLLQAISKQNIDTPTPIQKQAIPIALSGRDLIAIAKTGSGKTATFIWPSIPHIMDQPYLEKGDGPIALFLAPTRELAQQIYLETLKYSKYYKLRTSVLYGGVSKQQQCKELKLGCEIIISTPGRLIDMIKLKATKLNRVTYLVLDEADKMFDFGFGPQVLSIVNHVRPDRQTLLFSATFKQNVDDFARSILTDPIKISIGQAGSANSDITQIVQVLKSDSEKWDWLISNLPSFINQGSVLIFVSMKTAVEELSKNLTNVGFKTCSIHGDKNQIERTQTIQSFKEGKVNILIATDVASRGLDIPLIKNVINFDPSRDIESHTHRIGRTGRAGAKGDAYTLITPKDINFAADLVKNLESANQYVPLDLITIAMNNPSFRRERTGSSRGGRGGRSGRGFRKNSRGGFNNNNNNRFERDSRDNQQQYNMDNRDNQSQQYINRDRDNINIPPLQQQQQQQQYSRDNFNNNTQTSHTQYRDNNNNNNNNNSNYTNYYPPQTPYNNMNYNQQPPYNNNRNNRDNYNSNNNYTQQQYNRGYNNNNNNNQQQSQYNRDNRDYNNNTQQPPYNNSNIQQPPYHNNNYYNNQQQYNNRDKNYNNRGEGGERRMKFVPAKTTEGGKQQP